MHRRHWLRLAGSAAASAAFGQSRVPVAFIGVGERGTGLLKVLLGFPEVDIPAVCDIDPGNLSRALDLVEKARGRRPEGYDDYRRMLARDDFRAVLIATPQELHGRMSLDALRAGKFTASEVPACTTLDECWDLVRTQRKTRAGYMLLENYRYSRHVMQVANMAGKGLFGDLSAPTSTKSAPCGSSRTARSPGAAKTWPNTSATSTPRIRWGRCAAGWESIAATAWSPSSPWRASPPPRPSGMGQYGLQGTRGAYASAFGEHKVYLEERSTWEPLEKYRPEHDHPYWATRGGEAAKTGHSGGDYFVLADFHEAIRTGESPIDVVDAATWSCLRPLSAESLRKGSAPIDIPNFKV